MLALMAVAGPALVAVALLLWRTPAPTVEAEIARWLGVGAAVAATAVSAWWVLGLVGLAATAVGRLLHRPGLERWGRDITPRAMRGVAAALLGLHVVTAPAALAAGAPAGHERASLAAAAIDSPALGRPVDAHWPTPGGPSPVPTPPAPSSADTADTGGAALPDASWLPRTPSPAPPGHTGSARLPEDPETVTVRAGDCLWDLAEAELGPDATPREVDRRWRDWYRENRRLIGEDPSVLTVGTVLRVPPFLPHLPSEQGPGTTTPTAGPRP